MNETPGHDAMAKRMVRDHWSRVTSDRRLELIEAILLDDPPIHRQWDYAKWQAERIIELIDNGVIPEDKEVSDE